jgi:indole-3-glycerol phosphate synthase
MLFDPVLRKDFLSIFTGGADRIMGADAMLLNAAAIVDYQMKVFIWRFVL